MQYSAPGKFEITKEGIVHDMMAPGRPHELTAAQVSRRLEKVMPDELLAHTGTPDVEEEPEGIMRHPDVVVIAIADMEGRAPSTPAPSSPPSKSSPAPTPTTTGWARCGTTPARHSRLRDLRPPDGNRRRPLRHPRDPGRPPLRDSQGFHLRRGRHHRRVDHLHGGPAALRVAIPRSPPPASIRPPPPPSPLRPPPGRPPTPAG